MFDSQSLDRGFRGKATIYRKIHKTGCTLSGAPVWTLEEKQSLRLFWPDMAKLQSELPRRSPGAIRKMASTMSLIPPRRVWQDEEAKRLPPPYRTGVPVTEIGRELGGKSKTQVWSKAFHMKVRRPRRPLKLTGMDLVDQIRDRAWKQGYTMADLDEWTNRKSYFTAPKGYNWRALTRALKVLGGKVVPVWPE